MLDENLREGVTGAKIRIMDKSIKVVFDDKAKQFISRSLINEIQQKTDQGEELIAETVAIIRYNAYQCGKGKSQQYGDLLITALPELLNKYKDNTPQIMAELKPYQLREVLKERTPEDMIAVLDEYF